jgi:hypothetical protein
VTDRIKPDAAEVLLSGGQSSNEQRAQASAMFLQDEDEAKEEGRSSAAAFEARVPYPINIGGAQLLPGRTRRCCFWISALVPPATRFIIDSTRLLQGGSWTHNPAGDVIPEDCLLVVVSPRDADQIRKAMATYKAVPHPSVVAARIIDEECRKDPTLSGSIQWRVRS